VSHTLWTYSNSTSSKQYTIKTFLAESNVTSFIAMFGYCHDMWSVVCLSSVTRVYCDNDKATEDRITRFSVESSDILQLSALQV